MSFPIAGAVAVGANVLGGLFGSLFSSADRNRAINLSNEAYEEILKTGAPPDIARQIFLEKFQSAGLYVPQLEQAINQAVSNVSQIQEDPKLRDAQIDALNDLKVRGQTGLTAEERLAFNKLHNQAQADSVAGTQAALRALNAQGQGRSGAVLAARLSGAQNAANNESMNADEIAAQASSRALQSIIQSGNLGSQIRSQDFNVNQTRAAAEDEMNRFNIANQMATNARNVSSINQGNLYNLQNNQNIANQNVQQANNELIRQRNAEATKWAMDQQLAQAISNAKLGQANIANNQAAQTQNTIGSIGAAVGQGISAINADQNAQQERDSRIRANDAYTTSMEELRKRGQIGLNDQWVPRKSGMQP